VSDTISISVDALARWVPLSVDVGVVYSKTTCVVSGAGSTYTSGSPEFNPGLLLYYWVCVALSLVYISLLVPFPLAIVLAVLRFMTSVSLNY